MERRVIEGIKFCYVADFASDKPPRTRPGGSVWVEILFKGYYWKSEARMKRRRKNEGRKQIAEPSSAELSVARPEFGRSLDEFTRFVNNDRSSFLALFKTIF